MRTCTHAVPFLEESFRSAADETEFSSLPPLAPTTKRSEPSSPETAAPPELGDERVAL
jgi:hypothetical protein